MSQWSAEELFIIRTMREAGDGWMKIGGIINRAPEAANSLLPMLLLLASSPRTVHRVR